MARNIPYEGYQGIRLPKEVQRKRVMEVIRRELTDCQRETLLAYYIEELNIIQIAQRRGYIKAPSPGRSNGQRKNSGGI